MPAIAHMICHSCGAHSEGSASLGGLRRVAIDAGAFARWYG